MSNNPFFNRPHARRFNAYGGHQSQRFHHGPNNHHFYRPKPSSSSSMMNFSDNFIDHPPISHNSTMLNNSFRSEAFANHQNLFGSSSSSAVGASMDQAFSKPSFSSLFASGGGANNSNPQFQTSFQQSSNCPQPFDVSTSTSSVARSSSPTASLVSTTNEDEGVYLQISNLDQWYDEVNLRNYLMNQLKPITPILSLSIETPSIAKVKVPSIQFAKQVVSHMHRKKMGHKRIFVSFMKDKTSAECSALRNKVIGLLRDVPSHTLQMCKFRELFQSRFKSSISILDLYKMPDIVDISLKENDEKSIQLKSEHLQTLLQSEATKFDQTSAPYSTYCVFHYKPDKNKGWAEIEIEPLPNVMMNLAEVQAIIHPLLRKHRGEIPIASLLYCLEAELNVTLQKNDRGVPLEHLVSAIPGVEIKSNDYGIKILSWHEDTSNDDVNGSLRTSLNLSCGEAAENISKEVIELVKMCPKSTMLFSKFIPTYHNHFGKQCRVADYGCTKLIELFEAMGSIVQVLGEGESRQITLTHRTQVRRFSTDVFKILRAQPNKSMQVSTLSQAYLSTHNRIFDVTDYGVCYIEDLLDGLRNNNFITVSRKRDDIDDVFLYIQKRRQSNVEIEKTSIFAGEVVDLLRNSPQFSIPFRKFVRSYHYYFGFQCKLSDYGFIRLAELLESLHGIVEMDQNSEENKKIFLSRKVALRVFSEQLHSVIKEMTGKSGVMTKLDDILDMFKNQFGYQIQGPALGYGSVIDALKFVPFIEINSFNNELWITHHMNNEKFRQRSLMACLVIVDIGVRVPLAKFHSVFAEKFKFNINEKSLHAMKHAVEIEMVNGVKMISLTPLMKFVMHIVNILEHKPKKTIAEIKSTMKLNLTSTFNLGYPNISCLIRDFTDIFITTDDKGAKDCYVVELHPECPLTSSGLKKVLDKKKVQLPDEKPEMFNSPKINSKLPPKMRCIQKPTSQQHSAISALQMQNNNTQPPHAQYEQYYRNLQMYGDFYHLNNPFTQHSSLPDVTVSTPKPNDVTTQFINYQQMQQPKFTSNSNPFVVDNMEKQQSFYERNLRLQQQQQYHQAMKQDYMNNSSGVYSASGCSSSSASLTSSSLFDSMHVPYSMMNSGVGGHSSSFNPTSGNRFNAPKPDTPPSKPLWLDPVWNCDGNFSENRQSASGTNDPVKGFNFQVVSPFLSFKTMFTFDNPSQSN